jgi:hypothetical protein
MARTHSRTHRQNIQRQKSNRVVHKPCSGARTGWVCAPRAIRSVRSPQYNFWTVVLRVHMDGGPSVKGAIRVRRGLLQYPVYTPTFKCASDRSSGFELAGCSFVGVRSRLLPAFRLEIFSVRFIISTRDRTTRDTQTHTRLERHATESRHSTVRSLSLVSSTLLLLLRPRPLLYL